MVWEVLRGWIPIYAKPLVMLPHVVLHHSHCSTSSKLDFEQRNNNNIEAIFLNFVSSVWLCKQQTPEQQEAAISANKNRSWW